MNRIRNKLIRLVWVAGLVFVVAFSLHHRFNPSVIFPAPKPDAAVALRSLTAATRPVKPWITDLASFSADNPGRWIVGHCAGPCLSQGEARQSADDDAARQIYDIVIGRLGSSQSDWLARQVRADVRSGELVSDQQLEKFDRPYGTLWTHTVLLDASAPRMEYLFDHYRTQVQLRSARMENCQIGAFALLLLVWTVYALINSITRGYFTLRLQLIAGTITAMALVVLLGIK